MITKAALKERLAELEENRQQLLAQLNSCMGNIQDCQHWLSQLTAVEAAKTTTENAA